MDPFNVPLPKKPKQTSKQTQKKKQQKKKQSISLWAVLVSFYIHLNFRFLSDWLRMHQKTSLGRSVSQFFQRRGTLCLLLVIGTLAILYYTLRTDVLRGANGKKRQRTIIPQSRDLFAVPDLLQQETTCPACLGRSVCDDIRQGFIKIRPHPYAQHVYGKGDAFYGKFEEGDIVLKTIASKEDWNKFDKFLCQNVTHSDTCDIPSTIRRSYMSKPDIALTAPHLKQAYRIVHEKTSGIA